MAADLPQKDDVERYFRRSPFNEWLDIRVADLAPKRAVLTVPEDEKFDNPEGSVHGGIFATLVNVAAGAALLTVVEDPWKTSLVTTDVTIRYLRPASSGLRAVGRVERAGSSSGVASVDIEPRNSGSDETTVAMGSASYRFL